MLTAAPVPTIPASVLHDLADRAGVLESPWTVAAASALLTLVAAATVRRVVRRSRRRSHPHPPRVWPALSATALCALLVVAVGANALSGYVPTVAAARVLASGWTGGFVPAGGGAGRVRVVSLGSRADGVPPSDTYVYTPPGYDDAAAAGTRYPVLYLVHGTPGTSTDWFSAGDAAHTLDVLIEHRLLPPMIVVAPDANGPGVRDTECLDSTTGGPQIESYLTKTVVGWTDQHLRTQADWQHRWIGGMSMGGFCALDQGLRHPELFGGIMALEPYGDPGSGGTSMLATPAESAAHSPSQYLPTIALPHPVSVYFGYGADASPVDQANTRAMLDQVLARGQVATLRSEPGTGHDWRMARSALAYGLLFLAAHPPSAAPAPGASAPTASAPTPAAPPSSAPTPVAASS